jgi:hypothetical protein
MPSGTSLATVPAGPCTVTFNTNVPGWTGPPGEILTVTNGQWTQMTNIYWVAGLRVNPDTNNDLNGIVAWWTMDDLSGADLSGNGYTLAFTGSPTSAPGQITNAVAFNGVSQFGVSSLYNLSFPSGTVTWWQNPSSSYSSGAGRPIWGQLTGGNGVPEFSCQVFSDNNWYAGWHTSANDARVVIPASASNYAPGAWNFYALTWSPFGTGLLMNGVQIGTNATPPSISNIAIGFCVGVTGSTVGGSFPGALDDVRVYNRALSVAEIAKQYQWPFANAP